MSQMSHGKKDISHSSFHEPRAERMPHWLERAALRMALLERRIALAGRLVGGTFIGANLGALCGRVCGDTPLGLALGGLTGAAIGRLWHELVRR